MVKLLNYNSLDTKRLAQIIEVDCRNIKFNDSTIKVNDQLFPEPREKYFEKLFFNTFNGLIIKT